MTKTVSEELKKEKAMTSHAAGQVKASSRMANLELLRCLAMMMVVVLHYLGKGEILPDPAGASLTLTGAAAWLAECFCIVAVNVYMLLSGYFLCSSSFKLSRLIRLYIQVWLYSVIGLAVAVITGIYPMSALTTHDLLTAVFPVSMGHYWFITAYVFLYILLPFLGNTLQRMSREQMQISIGILLFFFCLLKSVLPVRLEMDGLGYDCIWYLCVFMTASYVRRFGLRITEKLNRSFILYVVSVLLIFGFTMGLRAFYLATGSLGRLIKVATEYNHLFAFLAAIGLLGVFLHLKINKKAGVIINKIAPYSLGVYLLHENLGLRYGWQGWLGAGKIGAMSNPTVYGGSTQANSALGILWLAIGILVAAIVVFAVGVFVDWLRELVMKHSHKILSKLKAYRKVTNLVEKADGLWGREREE